jgi:hypothetical protein
MLLHRTVCLQIRQLPEADKAGRSICWLLKALCGKLLQLQAQAVWCNAAARSQLAARQQRHLQQGWSCGCPCCFCCCWRLLRLLQEAVQQVKRRACARWGRRLLWQQLRA